VSRLIAIKVLASTFEFIAAIIFAFALFRIPVDYKKTFIISVIVSVLSYYIRSIPDIGNFVPLSIIICQVILIFIFFRLPIFYSLLITILCILETALFEFSVMWLVVNLKLTSMVMIQTNPLHTILIVICAGCISLILAWILRKKKIGFMFMVGRFTVRQSVSAYNFGISAALIISLAILQVAVIAVNRFNVHGIILISLAIILLGAIYIAYRQNRKLLDEKYERLGKMK
jgi:hypothetical protein